MIYQAVSLPELIFVSVFCYNWVFTLCIVLSCLLIFHRNKLSVTYWSRLLCHSSSIRWICWMLANVCDWCVTAWWMQDWYHAGTYPQSWKNWYSMNISVSANLRSADACRMFLNLAYISEIWMAVSLCHTVNLLRCLIARHSSICSWWFCICKRHLKHLKTRLFK